MTNINQFSSNNHSNHNDYTKEPENHLNVNEAKWFAIYTNYKREKTVKKDLDAKGITAFLPIQKVIRNYASKRKTVELPLISCYLLVCLQSVKTDVMAFLSMLLAGKHLPSCQVKS